MEVEWKNEMFRISDVKINRIVLIKAIGICALGWLAVPLIYVLLKKNEKEVEEENETIPGAGREDKIPE